MTCSMVTLTLTEKRKLVFSNHYPRHTVAIRINELHVKDLQLSTWSDHSRCLPPDEDLQGPTLAFCKAPRSEFEMTGRSQDMSSARCWFACHSCHGSLSRKVSLYEGGIIFSL
jgi:hypothetical protein